MIDPAIVAQDVQAWLPVFAERGRERPSPSWLITAFETALAHNRREDEWARDGAVLIVGSMVDTNQTESNRTPTPDYEDTHSSEDESSGQPGDEPSSPGDPTVLPDGNYVGENNIRDGRVGGVMGPTHQQGGEGQGG